MRHFTKKVKNVGVVYRDDSEKAKGSAVFVANWLSDKSIKVFSHPEQELKGAAKLESPDDLDMVVVLGGDGTYLKASRMLNGSQVPLLGFNMGNLGFLTLAPFEELLPMLELALAGKLETRTRSMIQIDTVCNGEEASYLALNDLVIQRGSLNRLITITVSIDNVSVSCLKADGLIIATPTGSSAYSMAAGGPLIHPKTRALVLTPLSSHSLMSRPLVVSDDEAISFSTDQMASLCVDGVLIGSFSQDDKVSVIRSKSNHVFLIKSGYQHFSIVKKKLKFGECA